MNLGETIKSKREEIGIARPDFARRCNVTRQHIYEIENGKRFPSVELLRRIAINLDTDLEPLLNLLKRRQELITLARNNPEKFEAMMLEEK